MQEDYDILNEIYKQTQGQGYFIPFAWKPFTWRFLEKRFHFTY